MSSSLIFDSITTEAMQHVWNRTPRSFQLNTISHVIRMRCHPHNPQATLLVQGTGGGKSTVHQTIGTVDGGVTVVIEPTLSLGADQSSKIDLADTSSKLVKSFQLDGIKNPKSREDLNEFLCSLSPTTNASIFLFLSPEELLKKPWCNLLIHLISKNILRLVCIDEVHQFVLFGTTFRKAFCLLKKALFDHVIDKKNPSNSSLSLPIFRNVPLG